MYDLCLVNLAEENDLKLGLLFIHLLYFEIFAASQLQEQTPSYDKMYINYLYR